MGIWSWFTGNSVAKNNDIKIDIAKRELQLMTKEQKIARLRQKGDYYIPSQFKEIDSIYNCDFDITTAFIICYLLFMDEEIRDGAEMEDTSKLIEEVLVGSESEVAEEVVSHTEEAVLSENVVLESNYSSNISESDDKSCSSDSYDSGGGGD